MWCTVDSTQNIFTNFNRSSKIFLFLHYSTGLPLLKHKVFAMYVLGIIFQNIGVPVAVLFLTDKAVSQGVSKVNFSALSDKGLPFWIIQLVYCVFLNL